MTGVDDRSPSARPKPPADASVPAAPSSARTPRARGLSAFRPKNGVVLRDIEALPYDAIAATRRGGGPSPA